MAASREASPPPAESRQPEPRPPESLRRLQERFGRAMATPIDIYDADGNYRLAIDSYPSELTAILTPCRAPKDPDRILSGDERLSSYNQQYWFRLFSVMQEEYPLLSHLLGVTEFNRMVGEYLTAYPSPSRLLHDLSDSLAQFLAESPRWNVPKLRGCAELEYIYIQAFDAKQERPLDPQTLDAEQREAMLQEPLHFQPHWFLYSESWNFVETWPLARHDPDYAVDIDVDAHPGAWAIYRGPTGIENERLGGIQYQLLVHFRDGVPFAEACERTAALLAGDTLDFMHENIGSWFQHWVSLGWFVGAE